MAMQITDRAVNFQMFVHRQAIVPASPSPDQTLLGIRILPRSPNPAPVIEVPPRNPIGHHRAVFLKDLLDFLPQLARHTLISIYDENPVRSGLVDGKVL